MASRSSKRWRGERDSEGRAMRGRNSGERDSKGRAMRGRNSGEKRSVTISLPDTVKRSGEGGKGRNKKKGSGDHAGLPVFWVALSRSSKRWRGERDSNPRYGSPYTRFPIVRLRPAQPSPHTDILSPKGGICNITTFGRFWQPIDRILCRRALPSACARKHIANYLTIRGRFCTI